MALSRAQRQDRTRRERENGARLKRERRKWRRYDARHVTFSFNGVEIRGYADGAFIDAELDVATPRTPARSGTIRVTLMQTSPDTRVLDDVSAITEGEWFLDPGAGSPLRGTRADQILIDDPFNPEHVVPSWSGPIHLDPVKSVEVAVFEKYVIVGAGYVFYDGTLDPTRVLLEKTLDELEDLWGAVEAAKIRVENLDPTGNGTKRKHRGMQRALDRWRVMIEAVQAHKKRSLETGDHGGGLQEA